MSVSLAAMEELLRRGGAERVSEDAKIALKKAVEDYAIKIGGSASKYARHARRKTVKSQDIELALQKQ